MGTYTKTSAVSGAAITAAWLNTELTKIETAINSLGGSQFGADCVPLSALATDYAQAPVVLHDHDITTGLAAVMTNQIAITHTCTLTAVKVICDTMTANVSVDVRKNGTSVLSGLISVAAADTVYSGTVTTSAFAAGDKLQLYITTDGTGVATDLNVTCLFKSQLIS